MNMFPLHHFKITLPFDKKEVMKRIYNNTESSTFAKTRSKDKKFIGTFTDSSFKIKKSLNQNHINSFIPIALGELKNDVHYCNVYIKMRPSILVIIFMLFWMWFFGKALFTYFIVTSAISFFNLAFIILGYFFMNFSFWQEAPETEKLIIEILNGNKLSN